MPRGGSKPKPVTIERIHARCVPEGECLLWTGATAGQPPRFPYGIISIRGRMMLTHRVVYELTQGPIPEGFEIDHTCTRGLCCEPTHLQAVTPTRNKQLTHERGHGRNQNDGKERCPRDHPYDVVRTRGDGRTFRACRTCEQEAQARYRAKRALAKSVPDRVQ